MGAGPGTKRTFQDESEIKQFDAGLFKKLLALIKPYSATILLALLMLLLGRGLSLYTPVIIKNIIDGPIAHKELAGLLKPAVQFFVVLLFSFLALFGQVYLTNYAGQNIIRNLRLRLFRHTQSLSMGYFAKNPVGKIMSRIVNDTDVLNELFSSGLITVLGDVFSLVLIVGFMLSMNVKLTLVSLAIIPLVVMVSWGFKLRIREQFRRIRVATADINTHLQESINGMSTLQLFNQTTNDAKKFDRFNLRYLDHYKKTILYFSLFFPIIELLGTLALCLIVWYGGIRYITEGITVGVLVAFVDYIRKMFFPIRDLAEKYNIMQNAMASSERIFHLLDEKPAVRPPENPVAPRAVQGGLEFKKVCFAYHPEKPVLENVSFSVAPGQTVAVVGATGAGKTTLMHLVNRFYDPVSGEILIDGVPTTRFALSELRRIVGSVSQDIFLFSDSIMENIRLGNNRVEPEKIRQVSAFINADKFIANMENGYDEVLVEKGDNISVGQKQLLSFARVLSYGPRIIILDEATSSIDPSTEVLIQEAIEKLTKGRTCIIVAHRLSTIQTADKIVVLHHGRVAETGTHDALMKREGIYYRLYRLQFSDGGPARVVRKAETVNQERVR